MPGATVRILLPPAEIRGGPIPFDSGAMHFHRYKILLTTVPALLAGCGDLLRPDPAPEPALFERYVAIGNSITAGFESEGINDSTQMHSYAVLLARKANARFEVPLLRRPGCPPPLTEPIVVAASREERVVSCAGFLLPVPERISNLSFPGFRIADALAPPTGLAAIFFLQAFGDRSLLDLAARADPTLVTIWLGNNDVLGAGLAGDTARMTPVADFQASVDRITQRLREFSTLREVVFLGVIDPQLAPALQPGAYLWAAYRDEQLRDLLPRPIDDSCAPFAPSGEPNPTGANLVSLRALQDGGLASVSCADEAPHVLNGREQEALRNRVAAYNESLRRAAERNGWIFLDVNALLAGRLGEPEMIRKCQGLATATDLGEVLAAVTSTCPYPGAPNFFGSLISYDGVHPGLVGQSFVADALAEALIARHGAL